MTTPAAEPWTAEKQRILELELQVKRLQRSIEGQREELERARLGYRSLEKFRKEKAGMVCEINRLTNLLNKQGVDPTPKPPAPPPRKMDPIERLMRAQYPEAWTPQANPEPKPEPDYEI